MRTNHAYRYPNAQSIYAYPLARPKPKPHKSQQNGNSSKQFPGNYGKVIPFPSSSQPKQAYKHPQPASKPRAKPKPKQKRISLRLIAWSGFMLAAVSIGIGSMATSKTTSLSTNLLTQNKKIADIEWNFDAAMTDQTKRITALAKEVDLISLPPQRFKDAQELFKLGKYAEAEAAYGRFISENPTSRLTEIALFNSAIANCQMNNMTMVKSRLEMLKQTRPNSELNTHASMLLKSCRLG